MKREPFLKLLTETLYPRLRSESFRGSGSTLRRIREPVIHLVNVQGSSSADGFYVNLGAHLTFLPTEGGRACIPAKIKEYECAFRSRLDLPEEVSLDRWPYGNSPAEAESIVAQLARQWQIQGHQFFERYARYPDSFANLVHAFVTTPPHPGEGLKVARLAMRLGLRDEAMAIARRALDGAPEGATALRAALRAFVQEEGNR